MKSAYLAILLAFGLMVAGCGGGGGHSFQLPQGNNGVVPAGNVGPTTMVVGPAGGQVLSQDGTVQLNVPAGVFPANTTVTLTSTAPLARSGPEVVSNVCRLQVDPAPSSTLDPPPVLTFLNTTGDANSRAVCQQRGIQGNPLPSSDQPPTSFFLPGEGFFNFDSQGHPQLQLPLLRGDQTFCTASREDPGNCQPTQQALTPPPAPPGTTYIGREVVINGVYVPEFSTVPIDRNHDPTDALQVNSETRTSNGQTDCDIVVVHVFAQPGKETCPCVIPPEMLVPPPTPAGFRPVGHTVVKNFVAVEASGDLTRVGKETDITVIRSRTVVVNAVVECDIVVGFDFEQIVGGPPVRDDKTVDSTGGTLDLGEAAPVCLVFPPGSLPQPTLVSLELVPPDPNDNAIFWPRVRVTLDPVPAVPLPIPAELKFKQVRSLAPLDVVRRTNEPGTVSGSTDPFVRFLPRPTRKCGAGLSTWLGRPGGVYAVAKRGPCRPSDAALMPPPAPPGTRYLGAEVVVDFVYQSGLSTLPLDRGPAPTDNIFITSETVVVDGVACDVIVAHYFEPQANDQMCPVPAGFLTPPPAPPGTRFVGHDLVLNFKLQQSTVPLDRASMGTDTSFIRSNSTVLPNGTLCDYIVRFLYEPIP